MMESSPLEFDSVISLNFFIGLPEGLPLILIFHKITVFLVEKYMVEDSLKMQKIS